MMLIGLIALIRDAQLLVGACFLVILSSLKKLRSKIKSQSPTEFKYRVMSSACFEIVWLCGLLGELGFPQLNLTPFHADNTNNSNCY